MSVYDELLVTGLRDSRPEPTGRAGGTLICKSSTIRDQGTRELDSQSGSPVQQESQGR